MFIGNSEKVYMLDKAESNTATINGHPAWGSVYDIASQQTSLLDVSTNVFCASGMHLPNGSFLTFGGNGAVSTLGDLGSENNGYVGTYDDVIGDYDGRKAIRVLSPCTGDASTWDDSCQWFDNATQIAMQKDRWYSAAEPLADGTVAIIGGFVNGGYINRNYPNTDPAYEGGAAEPTYEFYPSLGDAEEMQFMIDTSGLNSYALTYLMASGNMLLQANVSTSKCLSSLFREYFWALAILLLLLLLLVVICAAFLFREYLFSSFRALVTDADLRCHTQCSGNR